MKSVSFRDLLTVPSLSSYKEADLLNPKMDKLVKPFLHMFGIDTEYPVEYCANNHRDLNDNSGVGYRIVGEIRCDREFINSPWCDIIDRIAVSGYQDTSMTMDLLDMLSKPVDYESFADEDDVYCVEEFPSDQLEEDYPEKIKQLEAMRKKIIDVRGRFVTLYEEDC